MTERPPRVAATAPVPDLHERLPAGLRKLDRDLYQRVALSHAPVLDATLPRLTHLADHGKLWMGTAAVLLAVGGRRPSRAAGRGLLSLAVASTLANGPIKTVFRRRRPVLDDVPLTRRLLRQPTTHSFPSGHTASAFAFATGAAIEHPALALPLGALAAGVGASRVYTGVHYPGDVIAGALLGIASAVATTELVAAGHGRTASRPADLAARSGVASLPAGAGLTVVVNAAAGSTNEAFTDGLRARLPAAKIVEVLDASELPERCREAATSSRALGIAGGDGSINGAAKAARAAGVPLAVFPAGTHNHLAADLGLGNLDATATAIEAGSATAVDLAASGDHIALNGFALGLYPAYVRAKADGEARLGRRRAVLTSMWRSARGGRPLQVEIDGEDALVWGIYVGVGTYSPVDGWPTRRLEVGDGSLDVRVIRADLPLARTRALLATLGPTTFTRAAVRSWRAASVSLRSVDGRPLAAGVDGEHAELGTEATITIARGALAIYAPG